MGMVLAAILWGIGMIIWTYAGTKLKKGYAYPGDENTGHQECEEAKKAFEEQKALVATLESDYRDLAVERTTAAIVAAAAAAAAIAAAITAAAGSWIPGVNIALAAIAAAASIVAATAAGYLTKVEENIRALVVRLEAARMNLAKQEEEVRRLCP